MKLFMRNNYDNPKHVAPIKNPMDYNLICMRCAGMLGGKMAPRHHATWSQDKCDCCGKDATVTEPRDFIFR